jgi:hypothetical protein
MSHLKGHKPSFGNLISEVEDLDISVNVLKGTNGTDNIFLNNLAYLAHQFSFSRSGLLRRTSDSRLTE